MALKSPSYRIAASHFIMFSLLTYIFVTLGWTLTIERDPDFLVDRKAYYAVAFCFVVPLALSLVLLWGLLQDKLIFVRTWLLSMIPLTVLMLFLLLSAAIIVALRLQPHWGILLCTMPFILILWMSEGMIVVFAYLRRQQSKLQKQNLGP